MEIDRDKLTDGEQQVLQNLSNEFGTMTLGDLDAELMDIDEYGDKKQRRSSYETYSRILRKAQ